MLGGTRSAVNGEARTRHEDATPSSPVQTTRLSRRRVLQIAGTGAAAAALYGGLALLPGPTRRDVAPPPGGYPRGQYQVHDYGVRVRVDPDSGVDVIIPPVWNLVITANLARTPGTLERRRLEAALRAVEAAYAYAPSGVFPLVAYGLPYFRAHVPGDVFNDHLPVMTGADAAPVAHPTGPPALLDAMRFASDPPTTLLEANEVAFHFRSDVLSYLRDVHAALFGRSGTLAGQPAPAADLSDLFSVTSVRTGFVGAGLPRRLARAARLAVADAIPEAAPLFMGFTSTQRLGQASEEAVSFDGKRDALLQPLTSARPGDYFAGGTTMHLSHLIEDLDRWYALTYDQRAARMFHRYAVAPPGRVVVQTIWLNPNTAADDARTDLVIGHNEAVQRGSRSREGQALQLRVDFNTMDALDASGPTPGVHFLAFTPGSSIFHQSRQAMDAADLTGRYDVAPAANGINAFIRATRRQNFLVPPRAHRAFPLTEL